MLAFGLFALALIQPAPPAHAGHAEGWTDDPNLINIDSFEKLNLIRLDPDGDGAPAFEPYPRGTTPVAPEAAMNYMRTFFGDAEADAFYTFWLYNINPGNYPVILHACPDGCKGYELTQDFDLPNVFHNWEPIDNYSGVFDGNGHVITPLRILRENDRHVGLFRTLAKGAQVKNLGIVLADVKGYRGTESDQSTGVIAGTNHGTIENVFVDGQVWGQRGVGGIAGRSDGTIRTSWADVLVHAGFEGGGVVGAKSGGQIHNVHSRGQVVGVRNLGGLVGALTGGGKVEDSYTIAKTSSGFVLGNHSGGTVTTSYDLVNTAKAVLKGVTRHWGIYDGWDRGVWDLGNALEYPGAAHRFRRRRKRHRGGVRPRLSAAAGSRS